MTRPLVSRTPHLLLLLFLAVLACTTPAAADLVTWNFSGFTLNLSGCQPLSGSVTGYFVWNGDAVPVQNPSQGWDWSSAIVSYDIAVVVTNAPSPTGIILSLPTAFEFTPTNSWAYAGFSSTAAMMWLRWDANIENRDWGMPSMYSMDIAMPSPDALLTQGSLPVGSEGVGFYNAFGAFGYAPGAEIVWASTVPTPPPPPPNNVPLPPTVLLLGSGLLGLAGWRRFRKS